MMRYGIMTAILSANMILTGAEMRYIDYAGGSDAATGLSPAAAWKHHPWDPNFTGSAAAGETAGTFIFKGNVIYRGIINVRKSGVPDQPVTFTSDPGWGGGPAVLAGSEPVTARWEKSEIADVWVTRLPASTLPVRDVWEIRDGEVLPLVRARTPDWRFTSGDDVRRDWLVWDRVSQNEQKQLIGYGRRPLNFTNDQLKGATVWTDFPHLIGNPLPAKVVDYNQQTGALALDYPTFRRLPAAGGTYFVENALALLDTPGEFYYDPAGQKLYVRLPGDRDPNRSMVEIGQRSQMLVAADVSHLRADHLAFRFANGPDPFYAKWSKHYVPAGCVTLNGDCRDVTISDNIFEHVATAVEGSAASNGALMDQIVIRGNEIRFAAKSGIELSDGVASYHLLDNVRFLRVDVLDNRLSMIGLGMAPLNNHGAGIEIRGATLINVSGNRIDRCAGQGIVVTPGKDGHLYEDARDIPLVRAIVSGNQVTSPLLLICDYGGIETFQLGPVYIYNNLCVNPVGYRRPLPEETVRRNDYTGSRFSFAYYLDGSFQNYVFNNIACGFSSDFTGKNSPSAALMEVLGHNNSFFNNTFYRFGCGSRKQSAADTQFTGLGRIPGRSWYLGNLWLDIGDVYFDHDAWLPKARDTKNDAIDFGTMGFGGNYFYGQPRSFGRIEYGHDNYLNLKDMASALAGRGAMAASIGAELAINPLPGAAAGDFKLPADSPLAGKGVKFFVPWGLSRVVGMWNFYRPSGDAADKIMGENMYFSPDYRHRNMYRLIPANDLTAVHFNGGDFRRGPLENWIDGALAFNGRDQYCLISDAKIREDRTYRHVYMGKKYESVSRGADRQDLDMANNNFLLEAYVKVSVDGLSGTLVAKQTAAAGYRLGVNRDGRIELVLDSGGQTVVARTQTRINDNLYHHWLVEIDRGRGQIAVYLDGKAAAADISGDLTRLPSLANDGDFWVGKGLAGDFFKGEIDFLRVSRGTLADAYTDIGELYRWQFDGPFLYDFGGKQSKRNPGAW